MPQRDYIDQRPYSCCPCGQLLSAADDDHQMWLVCAKCGARSLNSQALMLDRVSKSMIFEIFGTLMIVVGLVGCVAGTPLVMIGEAFKSKLEGLRAFQATILAVVGFASLTVSGFVLLRGLKIENPAEAKNVLLFAVLLALTAASALIFMLVKCSSM
jgi:hypothetical protein